MKLRRCSSLRRTPAIPLGRTGTKKNVPWHPNPNHLICCISNFITSMYIYIYICYVLYVFICIYMHLYVFISIIYIHIFFHNNLSKYHISIKIYHCRSTIFVYKQQLSYFVKPFSWRYTSIVHQTTCLYMLNKFSKWTKLFKSPLNKPHVSGVQII